MFTQHVEYIDIDLTNICNARCPQCPRYDHDYRLRPGLNKNSLSVEDLVKGIDDKYWKTIKTIVHSGTTGEPTLNKQILQILDYEIAKCPDAYYVIHTNGDTYNPEWWNALGKTLSNVKHEMQFGIDGFEDTHALYRVGTDYNRVIKNARAFIAGGGYAVWQFILFKHNQHQVGKAKELAKEYGFGGFKPLRSTRFNYQKIVQPNGLEYLLEPSDIRPETKDDPTHMTTGLDSKETRIECASMKESTVYIYPDGTVWPCTFLGGIHLFQARSLHNAIDWSIIKKHVVTPFGSLPNIKTHKLSEILSGEQWNKWDFVNNFPTRICKQQCNACVESREQDEFDLGYRL
jgi:MoaA/NifB/PqqE/SkfB family radical SAM enzyme